MNLDFRKLFGWTSSSTLGGTADPGWFPPPSREYISIETAEQNTAVYRAVKLVSQDIGRLPVTGDGLPGELLEQPNELETWFDFCRKHLRYLMLYGNSFALISRNGFGEVVGLVSTTPAEMSLVTDDTNPNVFMYRHATFGDIDPADVLHWRLQGNKPFMGDSPIIAAARSLNLALTQERAGEQMYLTPGMGKIAIESPEAIGPDMVNKLQDAFVSKHGSKNGHATPIITQGGMKVTQVGQSLSDSDWITARRFSITEVARLFSVPPAFLYDLEHSTLENSASQMKSYVSTCLGHWLAIFCSEFKLKLGAYLHFDTTQLLQGTLKEQTEALRMAIDAGILTPNECRAQLGYEPVEGGDELVMSKNYTSAGDVNGTDTGADSGTNQPQEPDTE